VKIQVESIGNIALLLPQGRLDFGAAPDFQAGVERALSGAGSTPAGVIIDCAGLEYVSSAGLRVFVLAARGARRAKIAFAVCTLKPVVREVFDVSGFGALMIVYDDRAAALGQMPT